MPSYFYHISLELLPYADGSFECKSNSPKTHLTSLAFESAREALVPFQRSGNTNLSARTGCGRGNDRLPFTSSGTSQLTLIAASGGTVTSTGTHEKKNRCLVPGVLNPQYLSADNTITANSIFSTSTIDQGLRFDKISIESIDMIAPEQSTAQSKRPEKNIEGGNAITTGIGTDILGGLYTKGRYIPLDQKASDSVWGIVHLYRDAKETPSLIVDDYPSYLKGSSAARQPRDQLGGSGKHQSGERSVDGSSTRLPDEDCTTLCILAVPSYLSPSDFLGFVGEETRDDVSHFRMIRTARANRYMVLMKFRSGKKAREWQGQWNGKVFNSMEPETCHVVFVKSIDVQVANSVPTNTPKDYFPPSTPVMNSTRSLGVSTNQPTLSAAPLSTKPLAPPTPSLIELPTCPVCLERMDETTGLLTIICQHVFHCTCLQKWKGSGCPVCRYTLDDFGRRSQGVNPDGIPSECSVCHSDLNLWICLICGNIGCGRYNEAHAFAHFNKTSHAFAMDLATQRVWDYVSDAYVHRIIQSKTDGKLVELPAADNSALDPPDWTDAVPREKLENMSVEYTHLLTSQLESQRAYFEEIVQRAVDKASQASAEASSGRKVVEKVKQHLKDLQLQYDHAKENIPSLEREKDRAERRAEKFETMARKMEKEWREEKAMNENLVKRVELLTDEAEKLKAANTDLTEQNRDLTFFISGSEKLKDQGSEVMEGTISIPENSKKKNKGRRR